jgi:hypothetical protein
MQGLRSGAGIVAVTAGALALLSVPVVALATGPPEDSGAGQNHAPALEAPEAQVHAAPQAPPPAPPGQAKPKPSRQAEGRGRASAPTGEAPTAGSPGGAGGTHGSPPASQGGSPRGHAKVPSSHARVAPGHARRGSHEPAGGSSEPSGSPGETAPSGGSADSPARVHSPTEPTGGLELPSADAPEGDDGDVAAAAFGESVDLPEDANPATLPFTGLQLALLGLIGLTALAAGMALRRTTAD